MSSGQRKSERMFETYAEIQARKKTDSDAHMYRPLPFDHCALSLQPFETPVLSNVSNYVFDLVRLVPFIQQHKQDPISGAPMTLKDITKLTFHKNDKGKYVCPSSYKEFTDFTKIVAIKTSGQVFSWDAVNELNIKPRFWQCLVTGKPFTKDDIVVLQDPTNPERRNVNAFHHIRTSQVVTQKEEAPIRADPSMRKILSKVEEERKKAEEEEQRRRKREREELEAKGVVFEAPDAGSAAAGGGGGGGDGKPASASANFTMMGFAKRTDQVLLIPPKKTRRKGQVRLYTTQGHLDLTLHCDLAPVACESFLKHCASGYYKNVKFHRLIPEFMVQGGDPTGSGKGGESAFGMAFQDEFCDKLSHNKRGILSMANSGPRTNGSQFFILFAKKAHLDKKHTVFGEVSGGMETLDAIEKIPTNGANVPLIDIVITDTHVAFDPFLHLDEEQFEEVKQVEDAKNNAEKGAWFSNPGASNKPVAVKEGVGKYIGGGGASEGGNRGAIDFGSAAVSARKKTKGARDFGKFF